MFSKSKINEPGPKTDAEAEKKDEKAPKMSDTPTPSTPKAKPPASVLSADLTITGNIKTTGDINIEGNVEGDIRAHLLTVGEGATVKGECIADDVVVIAVQVDGRKRATISLPADHDKVEAETAAMADGGVRRALAGRAVRKVIVVPGRIVNVVT